jgi:hypothetical protein
MKQVEKLIIISCVLFFANLALEYGSRKLLPIMVNNFNVDAATALQLSTIASGIFRLMVPLAIAIWLYRIAKKDGAPAPWVWALLALIYQFLAPICYFALKIYQNMTPEPSRGNVLS